MRQETLAGIAQAAVAWAIRSSITGRSQRFFSSPKSQTAWGHSATLSVVLGVLSETSGREFDHSSPSSAEVKSV